MPDFFDRSKKAVDDAPKTNARRMGPPVDGDAAYNIQNRKEKDEYEQGLMVADMMRQLAEKRVSDASRKGDETMMDNTALAGHEGHGHTPLKVPRLRIEVDTSDGILPPELIKSLLDRMEQNYIDDRDPLTGGEKDSTKMKGRRKFGW